MTLFGYFNSTRSPNSYRLHLAHVFLFGVILALGIGQVVLAATPDDNGKIRKDQIALASSHLASVAGGLAPFWFGTAFEIAALGTDIELKNTPATLDIPDDLSVDPNDYMTGGTDNPSCVFKFKGRKFEPEAYYADGFEAEHASIFFINYDPLDDVWSELKRPSVYHPQASVKVRVSNPYLGAAGYSHLDLDEDTVQNLVMQPEFPEGRHVINWRANTYINYVLDVALPAALIPLFTYAENQLANKLAAKNIAKIAKEGLEEAAEEAAKKAAKKAAEKTFKYIFDLVTIAQTLGLVAVDFYDAADAYRWYIDTSKLTATNAGTQILTVWDIHTPYILDAQSLPVHRQSRQDAIIDQAIELEATDFGGVRFGRVADSLRAMFEPVDDCGKEFLITTATQSNELLKLGDVPYIVTWEAREKNNGPYESDTDIPYESDSDIIAVNQTLVDEEITTRLEQRILVVDTQAPILVPPEGFARYSVTDIDLKTEVFPLGRPLVVDLADPSPVVTNTAPDTLAVGRRHLIDWQATDASGNTTAPAPENPEQYTQIVTIKAPGTNTPPVAEDKSAATLTSQAVEVELTGIDTDLIDGRVDPLAFKIAEYPANGQFEAPLYPFFIKDFRLSPVGEREEADNLTRTSPLKHLADRFRLEDPRNHGIFLDHEICDALTGSRNQVEFNNTIPIDFVYQPSYVYVDDDGFYYIRDKFWVCGETPKNNLDGRPTLSPIPRISKWTDDGRLVAMRTLYPTDSPLYDDTNLDSNSWPNDDFSVDHNGRIWFQFEDIFTFFSQIVTTYSYDSSLGDMRFHGRVGYNEQELIMGERVVAIIGESRFDLLYELHQNGVHVRRVSPDVDLSTDDGKLGILDVSDIEKDPPDPGNFISDETTSLRGTDIKVDNKGNVYVLETAKNRIHKYAPTRQNDSGEWELGKYIGWLGSCSSNKLNPAGVPYNGCDEENGVSLGYSCTDLTCNRNSDTSGSGHGQFNAPNSIEIDPRDVLYVADTENLRVQRFGPDGTFAGEAKSTGTGVNQGAEPGFILGNMGKPQQLAVNSSSFYVMEPDAAYGDYFVHVFKTVPFYDVTDSSAKIKYVSEFRFQGTDRFSYLVGDGIDKSAPAQVTVAVARAFRAPERLRAQCFTDDTLATEIPCSVDEDSRIYIRLSAYDPDGFVSTGGLDVLAFNILQAPANGKLAPLSTEDNSALYLYTPKADFNGSDRLTFDVFDGVKWSIEQKAVALTIKPVPDPVVIDLPQNFTAARGFRRVLTADFSDVDRDPDYQPVLSKVNWGDNAEAAGPGWEGSGRQDANGREINPQEDLGVGSGLLIGSHIYKNAGSYPLQVIMQNSPAEGLADSVAVTDVAVIEATMVGVSLAAPSNPVDPDTVFPIEIDVSNLRPEGWDGLTARNTRLSIEVPDGLTIVATDFRCVRGATLDCRIGDVVPDQKATIVLGALVDLATARNQSEFLLKFEATDDGPKITEKNIAVASISITDQDEDGVIDVDDAFPKDPDYFADSDGDGLADAWEQAYGFDPNAADDTGQDSDGDGLTLLQEFSNRSYPHLAEQQVMVPGETLSSADNTAEDRFGQALAGGDLNLDGYADTVIGAPLHDGDGAVFISYGSADGTGIGLKHLKPTGGVTQFGRAVAVGDWDDNGYPDIAIAGSNAVAIHYNNGEILNDPDLVLNGATALANLGVFLESGDLDGDNVADLVVTAKPSGDNGQVHLYLSSAGGFDEPPLVFSSQTVNLGDSAAIADIDGDGAADLLLGAGFTGIGEVHGFLGAHNDWSTTNTLTTSFVLPGIPGQSSFGFSITSGADIGGDGVDDLVVGAYAGAGSINVYDSTTNYWVTAPPGQDSSVQPTQTINGLDDGSQPGDGYGDQFGVRLAMAHLDTDNYADVVVGANRTGVDDDGQVQIFRGRPSGLAVNPQIEAGDSAYDMLGYFVAIPGDINGDGFNDIAAGAPDIATSANPAPDGGYVRVYYHAFTAVNPQEDEDHDGVRLALDNCPATPNTDQSDLDGDGAGDICDNDIDGDGLNNAADNCPLINSTNLSDNDSDGSGDLCDEDDDNDGVADSDDAFPFLDQYRADTDGDGLPDAYENAYGLNPNDDSDANADLDGDGLSNIEEFRRGSDPAAGDPTGPNEVPLPGIYLLLLSDQP